MTDDKPFFVLRTTSGAMILNKTYVVLVDPLSREAFVAKKHHFPISSERR
jgi:hypothetical protein